MLCAMLRLLALAVSCAAALAQPTSTSPLAPPSNGMRRADPDWIALANATVHVKPGQVLRNTTILCRDGLITGLLAPDPGPDATPNTDDDLPPRIPLGPRVFDCTGLTIYAAFIDPYVEVDSPAPQGNPAHLHWNAKVTPQRSALDGPGLPAATAESLRKIGFATAAIAPKGGIFRGSSALVSLAKAPDDPSAPKPPVYTRDLYQSVAFELGGGYPGSEMGAIALIRQTLSDAAWQSARRPAFPEPPNALDALGAGASTPPLLLFNTDDELQALRAYKIAVEFSRPAMILGSGTEFRRLEAIRKDNLPFLLPLNFPRTPDASSLAKQDSLELRDMMTWEQAPTNPRRLAAAGIPFALTTAKLRDRGEFLKNLRTAIQHGLTPDQALAALTTTPAAILNAAAQLGTVEPGKRANLLVVDGDLFATKNTDKVKIRTIVIDAIPHEITPPPHDLAGTWDIELPGAPEAKRSLVITADSDLTIHRNDKNVKATRVAISRHTLAFVFDHEPLDGQVGLYAVTASIERNPAGTPARLSGQGITPDGSRFAWSATRRLPSLAGHWPILFDAPDQPNARPAPVLVFDDANTLTFLDETLDAEQKPILPANLTWDGSRLAYDITLPDGVARVEATADLAAEPPTLKGHVIVNNQRHAFTASRSKDHPMLGRWRVVRFDNKDKDPKDKSQVFLDIKKSGKGHSVTITFTGRTPADAAPDSTATSFTIEATDVTLKGSTLTYTHDLAKIGMQGQTTDTVRLVRDRLEGSGTLPGDIPHAFTAARDKPEEDDDTPEVPETYGLPFGPFAIESLPPQDTYILTNATVWNGKEVLEHAHVVIRDGRIAAVGEGDFSMHLPAGVNATTIDATGKHITAGIIDAHSHTGISSGVNEGGQAVTAEVRIQDVTDPDDVNWYRQLASGVTSVLQLHGSANAIGGQSQTIKIRWGAPHPDDMHFETAAHGIKFALGENPVGANGSRERSRYPGTRMGVEKLIRDRFTAAREYAAALASPTPPRRDLELEALAEILAGSRLVHCHSYRQDEILMLTHVARDFGFKIGTFQHILEGYKVADAVRDYSGGGSGFADWWAYKVEVQDAIPHGLPLMHEVGAVVSFNSDSAELVRRLNVEAAKAVKYGNEYGSISEVEALNFVTLNPAKQLRIDARVGSIEPGKDADLALWSGHPLSTFSRCEMTFVDGRLVFSLDDDANRRAHVTSERQRLIQKILTDGKKRKPASDAASPEAAPTPGDASPDRPRRRRPTDELNTPSALSPQQLETLRQMHLDALQSGRDPFHLPGVCGCYF